MTISWNSMTGGIYDLYSTTDFVSWSLEQNNIASAGTATNWVDNSASGMKKFYQVQQISPTGYRVKTAW